MDSNFKKVLENTFIDNNKPLTLSEINKGLYISMRSDKLKQALKLIYNDELQEIKQANKTYYNIGVSNTPLRTLTDNLGFFKINNKTYVKNNYNSLNDYFNLASDPSTIRKANKKINSLANDLIFYCLAIGVPEGKIAYFLAYTSTKATAKNCYLVYKDRMNYFKAINKSCSCCNKHYNLTLHHIEEKGKMHYLKYNPFNWLILCKKCHNDLHNNKIALKLDI